MGEGRYGRIRCYHCCLQVLFRIGKNTAADVGITDVDRREGNYHVLLIDGTRWLFNSYGVFIKDENAG